MKNFMLILSALVLFVISADISTAENNFLYPDKIIKVKVSKIVDGDTLKVELPQGAYSVRLNGIDCYESFYNSHINKQIQQTGLDKKAVITLGSMATKLLSQKVKSGDNIDLEIIGLDTKYGRLVGNIYKNGENLNDYMLSTGYCPQYIYKTKKTTK